MIHVFCCCAFSQAGTSVARLHVRSVTRALLQYGCISGTQCEAQQSAEGAAVGIAQQLLASGRSEGPETGGTVDGQSAADAGGGRQSPDVAGKLLLLSKPFGRSGHAVDPRPVVRVYVVPTILVTRFQIRTYMFLKCCLYTMMRQ